MHCAHMFLNELVHLDGVFVCVEAAQEASVAHLTNEKSINIYTYCSLYAKPRANIRVNIAVR